MRFPYWFPVDRHGLSALAMTRCVGNDMGGSVTTHTLSFRGGSEARDVAIHRVSRKGSWVMRFPVDRHGLPPRDDKTGKTESYSSSGKYFEKICPKYFSF